MAFDLLVHQVKSRSRSIQLEKNSLNIHFPGTTRSTSPVPSGRRSTSLPTASENQPPSNSRPSNVRSIDQVLGAKDPPTIAPWKPMSYEELYSNPVQNAAKRPPKQQPNGLTKLPVAVRREGTLREQSKQPTSQEFPLAQILASNSNRLIEE
jgi:hypothetical protein